MARLWAEKLREDFPSGVSAEVGWQDSTMDHCPTAWTTCLHHSLTGPGIAGDCQRGRRCGRPSAGEDGFPPPARCVFAGAALPQQVWEELVGLAEAAEDTRWR